MRGYVTASRHLNICCNCSSIKMNRKRLIMLWTLVANASSLIACSQWQERHELCFAAGSAGTPGQLGVSDPKWLVLKVALWLDCFEILLNSHLFAFFFLFPLLPPLFQLQEERLSLGIAVNSIWSCDQGWLHLNKAIMVACRVPRTENGGAGVVLTHIKSLFRKRRK